MFEFVNSRARHKNIKFAAFMHSALSFTPRVHYITIRGGGGTRIDIARRVVGE
jgi:hypothetical protein